MAKHMVEMRLDDGENYANSWLQDLKTLLERTRIAARRQRNASPARKTVEALLKDLVVAE